MNKRQVKKKWKKELIFDYGVKDWKTERQLNKDYQSAISMTKSKDSQNKSLIF